MQIFNNGRRNIIWMMGIVLSLSALRASAQNNVGIGTTTPDSTSILDLKSTTKGFLPPRLTRSQRDAITIPAPGLVIFNSTDSLMQYYTGFCWLYTYQENCTDCHISMSMSDSSATIDRTIADSVQTTINITQFAGTPQNVAFNVTGFIPSGLTYTINPNPRFSTGTSTLTFRVTPFTPAGTYPIVVQALCGPSIKTIIYTLTILPCYVVDVVNSTIRYNLRTHFYQVHPTAPTNAPVCVVNNIGLGVTIASDTTSIPAYTVGNLPSGSIVALVNNGQIIGRGGNGGQAEDPTNTPPLTGAGKNGGGAVFITTNTTVINNGYIFGGGGGGSAMAFKLTYAIPLPPPLSPLNIGFMIGSGGGGGAGVSIGGVQPNIIGLIYYVDGGDGSGGLFGVPGAGGVLSYPISFTQGPVTITLTPNAIGGNGWAYGYPGTAGTFTVTISATLSVNFPIIGTINIPVINNILLPIPVPIPLPGIAGYAIKRNSNVINITDNNYNTSFLKGSVGP